jgi:putative phosphoesterase
MKIAIISDIHENFHNLVKVLKEIEKQDVEQVIFLGDFINNGIAKVLANFSVPVFAVWGNNDGDKVAITKTSLENGSNLSINDKTYDFVEFGGRKIFLTHYPDLAKPMAESGNFDAVFYGHNHEKSKTVIEKCLVINPGEVAGHINRETSYALYETETNDAEIISISDAVIVQTEESLEYISKQGVEFRK